MTVQPALVSIGRRNSPESGPQGPRLECLHGSRHRPWPVEWNHEQARMVETTARHELDLCFYVTKLALNIANCCVGSSPSLSQAHHLHRPLVLHPRAFQRERVAVAAIGIGSVLAQSGQRSRQFTASLL
jgi:hypothetical protein